MTAKATAPHARPHSPASAPTDPAPWPAIVGPGEFGGHFAGELHGQLNLDYAATTPALRAAVDAVLRLVPAYGSVHRGGGARSRITTDAYEAARETVARFVDAGDDHTVVFVRNTTEAINLASASLRRPSRILCSPLEHHANLLPWRDHDVQHLPFVDSADALVRAAAAALEAAAARRRGFDVLAVCGASNVTGELLPVAELATVAHRWGTRILVDAAQLAPHRRLSVRDLDVDYLALSGHKLYAPFGCGALVVRGELLEDVPPLLKGGGAVRVVTFDEVAWAAAPHRLEAGTPNVLGAVALAAACDELAAFGMDALEQREQALAQQLWEGLARLPGCRVLRGWPGEGSRVAVASFTLAGRAPREVADALAREYRIAVRSGLFCAHPFVAHLLGTEAEAAERVRRAQDGEDVALTGAVRASIGIGVESEHVELLFEGLAGLARPPACSSRARGASGSTSTRTAPSAAWPTSTGTASTSP